MCELSRDFAEHARRRSHALQPPSMASLIVLRASTAVGATDAPAEGFIPWSTGSMKDRPCSNRQLSRALSERSNEGLRSKEADAITKSDGTKMVLEMVAGVSSGCEPGHHNSSIRLRMYRRVSSRCLLSHPA